MVDVPENEAWIKFADYVLEHFVLPTCNYLPSTWAATPDTVGKRTNNGTKSFHLHFNAQFYARHPNIFMFLEVINKIHQT